MARLRCKATILAYANWNLLRRYLEDHLIDLQTKILDRLTNQVAIPVADMLKLLRWNPHMECPFTDVREARRLQPRLKALAVDLLFQCTKDPNPLIQNGSRNWNK
jgi:hypothetical protein